MSYLRTIACVCTGLLLATFALPSFADDDDWWKQYTLNMAIVSAPPASPPFTVTAKIRNKGLLPIGSFTLSVTGLTIVGVSPPAKGRVVGSFPGSSVSITYMRPLFWSQSLTLTLQVSSCGDGAWTPVAWLGPDLKGPTLDLSPGDSSLETSITCASVASGATFTVPNSLTPTCTVTGERGYYDKNGAVPSGTLPIVVTNTVPTDDQMHFRWPDFQTGGDPYATFEYSVCGPGELPSLTDVAWLNIDGTPASAPGTPAYITANDCLANANFLPAPYGTLKANVGLTDTTLSVDTTMPPRQSPAGTPPGSVPYPGSAPGSPAMPGTAFDVVIDTERITVQLVCLDNDGDPTDASDCTEAGEGEALMVTQRGVGGTIATTHSTGALVMSTPLPLLPAGVPAPYKAGNQALMCIQSQTPECGQNETEGCDAGVHSSTFLDIGGDGWANHP